jgi:hypothetical protein
MKKMLKNPKIADSYLKSAYATSNCLSTCTLHESGDENSNCSNKMHPTHHPPTPSRVYKENLKDED